MQDIQEMPNHRPWKPEVAGTHAFDMHSRPHWRKKPFRLTVTGRGSVPSDGAQGAWNVCNVTIPDALMLQHGLMVDVERVVVYRGIALPSTLMVDVAGLCDEEFVQDSSVDVIGRTNITNVTRFPISIPRVPRARFDSSQSNLLSTMAGTAATTDTAGAGTINYSGVTWTTGTGSSTTNVSTSFPQEYEAWLPAPLPNPHGDNFVYNQSMDAVYSKSVNRFNVGAPLAANNLTQQFRWRVFLPRRTSTVNDTDFRSVVDVTFVFYPAPADMMG